MKIRWYEVLILSITAVCIVIFLCTYFSTVRAPGVWIATERGGAYTPADSDGQAETVKGIEYAETGESTLGKVNLNTADLEELTTLPGIGETRAQAILDYRWMYGDFQSVDDLLKVEGIGETLLDQIRNRITVS